MVRDEVVAAVASAPRTVAGAATGVEVTAAEEPAEAPVMPTVVPTAVVADLLAAVDDATGGTTSGRSAPRRRAASSPRVLGARVWPRGQHMLIGRGGAGDGAADIRRGSRLGISGICGEGIDKCSVMVGEELRVES